MATAQTKLLTAEEFFEFVHRPGNRDRFFELYRGEIIEMPPPNRRHGSICEKVAWTLGSYARQRQKGDVCTNDTGFIVERDPDTVRGPDVTFYDDVQTFDELPVKYEELPPKVAVEVLSPTDTWARMTRRITQMLRRGVALVWVVDPADRSVTVYRPGKEPYVVEEHEELTGDDVLPGFRCRVADFFTLPGQA
jgi:Uma2 family endonuclease